MSAYILLFKLSYCASLVLSPVAGNLKILHKASGNYMNVGDLLLASCVSMFVVLDFALLGWWASSRTAMSTPSTGKVI